MMAQSLANTLDQGWIFGRAEVDLEQSTDDLVHLFLHGVKARKETV